jgi:hypothetical protein
MGRLGYKLSKKKYFRFFEFFLKRNMIQNQFHFLVFCKNLSIIECEMELGTFSEGGTLGTLSQMGLPYCGKNFMK